MSPAQTADPLSRDQSRLRRQYLHAFVAAACVGPFLSFVLSDLGWSPAETGYAIAALTASAVFTAPAWGWIDDRLHGGAARLSLITTAAASMALTVSLLQSGTAAALVSIALLGSASGSLEPLLTTRALRNSRTAARLGTTRSLGSVGWILGLAIGGVLLTFTEHSALVFLLAGLAALTAPTPRRQTPPPLEPSPPTARRRGRPPLLPVLSVLSITFPLTLSTAALVFFTAGWARDDLGAGPLVAIGPLALSAALELPAFVLIDRLLGRLSAGWLCTLAFPPLAVAVFALAVLPDRGVLFAVQPLVAISFALGFVGQSRLVAERVDPGQLASGMTLVTTAGRGLAGPIAGVAGGALAAAGGYPALFFTLAGLCLLGFARALVSVLMASQSQGERR